MSEETPLNKQRSSVSVGKEWLNAVKGRVTWSDDIDLVPGVFVKPYSKSFMLNEG